MTFLRLLPSVPPEERQPTAETQEPLAHRPHKQDAAALNQAPGWQDRSLDGTAGAEPGQKPELSARPDQAANLPVAARLPHAVTSGRASASGAGKGQADPPPVPQAPAPSVSPSDLADLQQALGASLGMRFEVMAPVAIGGMAVIFPLRHRRTEGMFAAKVMRRELAGEPALREAFAREARIGAQLAGHPNAVPVLDVQDAGDLPYLLMPFIDGTDLDHVLRERGRLERDEAMMMLAQLASLLMYAETLGLVHADVALGNIRLDRFGQYRLLDYGLARSNGEEMDRLHALAGTPASNSPEQLRGERLDIRSDLYSLGLVLFHALAGRPAFPTDDLDELARRHLGGAWTMPPELEADRAAAALLRSMLSVDREHRMASAFELAGAMTALGYEQPSFLRSLPASGNPAPRLKRRRLEPAG